MHVVRTYAWLVHMVCSLASTQSVQHTACHAVMHPPTRRSQNGGHVALTAARHARPPGLQPHVTCLDLKPISDPHTLHACTQGVRLPQSRASH